MVCTKCGMVGADVPTELGTGRLPTSRLGGRGHWCLRVSGSLIALLGKSKASYFADAASSR